jgi:hypothetical protein
MKQLEFCFTETGANQLYLEHQLANAKGEWLTNATSYPFRNLNKKVPFKAYLADWIEAGKAKYFRILWHDFYFKDVVENQTAAAKRKFEQDHLFTMPRNYTNWPSMHVEDKIYK